MNDQPPPGNPSTKPILFYDGECGFCNGSVRFVIRHENQPALLFAPLQGSTAEEALRHANLPPDIADNSIVVLDKGEYLVRSRAAFRTMEYMGGIWAGLAKVFRLVPRPLADGVYRLIARYRKNLPQGESCELLPPDKRARLLP